MCVCLCLSVYVCVYVCVCVCVFMYECVCVCTCVCLFDVLSCDHVGILCSCEQPRHHVDYQPAHGAMEGESSSSRFVEPDSAWRVWFYPARICTHGRGDG